MSEDKEKQPIIIKRGGKHKHGHHGGAWKIALADFAIAMMAFFLVMWLLGSTTREEQQAIAGYFLDPSQYKPIISFSNSMVQLDSAVQKQQTAPREEEPKLMEVKEIKEVESDRGEAQQLMLLKQDIVKQIEAQESLRSFKEQIYLDIVSDGLRIQIIDDLRNAMFLPGRSDLEEKSEKLLHKLAPILNQVSNKISIAGHTDGQPFNDQFFSNWELSTERANAARRALIQGGLLPDRVARIVGLGSTVSFDDSDPFSPANRRISIVVLNKNAEKTMELKMKELEKDIALPEPPKIKN